MWVMINKKSQDERVKRAMEQDPDLPKEFVTDTLQATDEEAAILKMLEKSQAAYAKGDHQTAESAFATIRAKIEVYHSVVQLFEGDVEAAQSWLNEPAKALCGNTPLQHLITVEGADEVRDLIGRLEQGVIT